MHFIEPSFEFVENDNQLKTVEYCARICYASQDKMDDGSYIRFCKARFAEHHYAIFEHANFTFACNTEYAESFFYITENLYGVNYKFHDGDLIFNLNLRHIFELCDAGNFTFYDLLPEYYRIFYPDHVKGKTVLYRLVGERDLYRDYAEKNGIWLCEEGQHLPIHERFMFKTVKLTCQRAIWDELARHRRNALCCQSSRYCCYFKERFGGEIKYSVPEFLKDCDKNQHDAFIEACKRNEEDYFKLFTLGLPPQDARDILALGYSVDCVVTASVEQWKTIFERRTTKMAHPDIAYLMRKVQVAMLGE